MHVATRTTICVVTRDRFSLAIESLTAMLEGLDAPYRIVYVDGGSPPSVRDALRRLATTYDFTLLRTEHYLSPNEARNLAFRRVDTEFVAFVDNDVFFSPDWLANLEASADRHHAAAVSPVYGLAYGSLTSAEVHLAGADNHIVVENGRRHHRMRHHEAGTDLADVISRLEPRTTEQAEFHCFFARSDAIATIAPLDENLLSLNEHLDASMLIRELGGEIWLEPSVVVTYLIGARLELSDQPYYLLRWSKPWNEASIHQFHVKWDIDPDDPESAELLAFSDYKRYRAYRPYRSVMGRIQAWRGKRSQPLPDRVLAPVFFDSKSSGGPGAAHQCSSIAPRGMITAAPDPSEDGPRRPVVPDAEHIQNVYTAYTAAQSTNDADAAVALFASDAVVRDPVDGTPLVGTEQIRAFFAGSADVLESLTLTGAVRITADGHHAAAPMQAVVSFGGTRKTIDTLDVMTFDDDGFVTAMDAYYGPTNINDA